MKKNLIFLVVLSCLTVIVYAQQSKIEYGNNSKAGKYADIRGFKMYYEIYGKGKPVLIIHGNGGSINNFQHQIPYFSKSYQVIVADSRAHGKSKDDTDSLSYEMMADDLSALLDNLKLDSCYVIGWSDGGNNGLLLAIRHPEKVKKLAITGANLWPDSSAVDPFAYQWAMGLNDSIKKVPVTLESRNARKIIHLLSYEPHISTAQLKLIKCPALVIGGDNDVIRPAHTLLIASSIPSAYLWILPNSGHSTPIFYKDEFNRKIDEFLRAPYRKIEGMGKLD